MGQTSRTGDLGASVGATACLVIVAALVAPTIVHAREGAPDCPGQAEGASPAEHALCWFARAEAEECGEDAAGACMAHAAAWCGDAHLDDGRVANACVLALVRTARFAEAAEVAEYLTEPTPIARRCGEALTSVAAVRVVTNPPGGTVAVGGREYGAAPIEVRLPTPWWERAITVDFDGTEVAVSSAELADAFDPRACEMTDLIVEGPADPSAAAGAGDAVPSPREAAEDASSPEGPAEPRRVDTGEPAGSDGGLHTRWWFWTGAAVLVIGAVVAGVFVATSSDDVQRREPIPGDDGRVIEALGMP